MPEEAIVETIPVHITLNDHLDISQSLRILQAISVHIQGINQTREDQVYIASVDIATIENLIRILRNIELQSTKHILQRIRDLPFVNTNTAFSFN